MDHFCYRENQLFAEDVAVEEIAKRFGTPCYIYSRATLERHWHIFDKVFAAMPHLVCYAVKANGNLGLLNLLARLGSGFDIVSAGELRQVLKAGAEPKNIIFSGICKTHAELIYGLQTEIGCFNIESLEELHRLNVLAKEANKKARIALRINPNVDTGGHPYITTGLKANKFGIPLSQAMMAYQMAAKMASIEIQGIAFHIGSQLLSLKPIASALQVIIELIDQLREQGIVIHNLDIGGGLGVRYHQETPPTPAEYANLVKTSVANRNLRILLEPGRAMVANAGILVTKVEYLKKTPEHNFAIVDAGMNDLLRPSLYQAWHEIIPVGQREMGDAISYDIVGPVCESGDFLGKQRVLNIQQEDLLAVRTAGAYGFSMSSNYNARPRVPEIMVDGRQVYLIREREDLTEVMSKEFMLP